MVAHPLTLPSDGLRCPSCGYDVRGLPDTTCPECGVHFSPEALAASRASRPEELILSSLLFFLLAWLLLLGGIPLAPIVIILAIGTALGQHGARRFKGRLRIYSIGVLFIHLATVAMLAFLLLSRASA